MYVPLAIYSFKMSFCMVPDIVEGSIPDSSATTAYIANKIIAGALIVIEVEIFEKSSPANSVFISSTVSIATPTLPTYP